jgi:phospholipid/cholesterol/gamma-HCH transport system substrate-binding protein
MSTSSNRPTVIVGIFVFLAIIILVAGIFMLAGQQKRLISTIEVKAIFDDVAGLKTGNNVWFSGVKIGTIKTINFVGDSQVEVTMRIEEKAQQYIRQNSVARISSESFIGNKNIVIEGGTQSASPIADGDRIQAINPLNTDDLMDTLQKNNKNLVSITSDFKVITSRLVEGEGTVGAILADTVMADNFRAMVSNLQRASRDAAQASNELSRFTTKLNNPKGLANQVATDTVVYARLRTSMAQLKEATTSASAMMQNLQQVSTKLGKDNNAVGVLLSDEDFARQLKSTMRNLETSSQKFDENMEALQNNFLLRGFFKKQAKEEAEEQLKRDLEQQKQ